MLNGKLLKFILLIILLSGFFPARAQAFNIQDKENYQPNFPLVEIVNSTSDFMEITVEFPENPLFDVDGVARFNEEVYHHPADVGMPDLPVLTRDVEFPFGADYSIEIIDSRSYAVNLGEEGLPTTIPEREAEVEKCDLCEEGTPPEQFTITHTDAIFPLTPVQLVDTYVVRGHQVGKIQFFPVQYHRDEQAITIFQQITVRVNFHHGDLTATVANRAAYSSYPFNELLSAEILNYNQGFEAKTSRVVANEAILIISPPAFISTLSALVELKESQGHPVQLVSLTTTGTTPEAIKSYIKNAYTSWPLPPTYVILVGDSDNGAETMPAFTGLSSLSATDLYYGTVDGSDWIPDVFIGRLPARNTAQLTTMINNLKAYNNLTGREGWIKKAAFLASDDANYWQVAEDSQNYVIQNHTQPEGYSGTFPAASQLGGDKLFAHSNGAVNSDVINAINNRRSLITYTGHGSHVSWGAPGFSQANIQNISSTGTFSIVTSFACVTGDFKVTQSFGESWLLQSNKGAVTFIGSSASTYWGPDDTLERAMMDSLFSGASGANIASAFRFAGLMAIETSRPGTGTAQSRYYWEAYNLLGDPSLAMLIEPKEVDFTLSANPSSLTVCKDSSQATTVSVSEVNGFSNPVNLSVTALPTGISADFSQNPITPSSSSTLTLSSGTNTATERYALKINGDSGELHHEFALNLSVVDSKPMKVNLINPAHTATGVTADLTLTWEGTQADTYQIQIAKDISFNQIVASKVDLTQPFFTPSTPLISGTVYYWRVRAVNPCGSSPYSDVFQFTTLADPGECPSGTTLTQLYRTNFDTPSTEWQHSGTNDTWARSNARSYSPGYAFHSSDNNTISLQHLISPLISLPNTDESPINLNFWQWFDIESNSNGCFDGALLEITTDNGKTWETLNEDSLLTNPYTGKIATNYGNPMAGNMAWCGVKDWSETIVNLSQYAGKNIRLRFTQANDSNLGFEGWYVDDFSISACEATPDYRPRLNTTTISVSQAPGREVTFRLELTNAGSNPDTYSVDLNTAGWEASLLTTKAIVLNPGETTIIEISVTIPAEAEFGESEQMLLSVISLGDPQNPPATDSATIELKAAMMSFLPMVNNH